MREPLMVVGGGGFAREVLDVVEAINLDQSALGGDRFEVVGVVADPAPDTTLLEPYGVPYLGGVDKAPAAVGYVIGIGSGQVRARIDAALRDRRSPALVHPAATIGRRVTLGPGTIVCAGVRITNHVQTGRHVHLNLNTTVGHDTSLGHYVTAAPLAAISGNVTIGDGATIGTGASIRERVTIGAGATVAMGAAVVSDTPDNVTVVGVPAKVRT